MNIFFCPVLFLFDTLLFLLHLQFEETPRVNTPTPPQTASVLNLRLNPSVKLTDLGTKIKASYQQKTSLIDVAKTGLINPI